MAKSLLFSGIIDCRWQGGLSIFLPIIFKIIDSRRSGPKYSYYGGKICKYIFPYQMWNLDFYEAKQKSLNTNLYYVLIISTNKIGTSY